MNVTQPLLRFTDCTPSRQAHDGESFKQEMLDFRAFGKRTRVVELAFSARRKIPVFVNEFWTSKQRAAHSIHEISYRACFKPQLARFFIERLSLPGEIVYDPFMGRGTTLIEAALMGRIPFGCDISPLSMILTAPRLAPPRLAEIQRRLESISMVNGAEAREDLLVFYHPDTLKEICGLRQYLLHRRDQNKLDDLDRWIWMVAINRLTGHSPGFFSVYTLPPNQAVSLESQKKINEKRRQIPPRRKVAELIIRKSAQLLSELTEENRANLSEVSGRSLLLTGSCDATPQISSNSISLVVTSPPFLDIVDYAQDNWLRAWFFGIDLVDAPIWILRNVEEWQRRMTMALTEITRVTKVGGWVAFEVGEVRNGSVKLEEFAVRAGLDAGLEPRLVVINEQNFTKTANCWGVDNLTKGTNTNRIVLFQKI